MLMVLLCLGGVAFAQTTKQWKGRDISLSARKIEIDLLKETIVATGNCRLEQGSDLILTAGTISAKMTGRDELGQVEARDEVKIVHRRRDEQGKSVEIEGQSAKAVWESGEREIIRLLERAQLQAKGSETATLSAEQIEVDLTQSAFTASGACRLAGKSGDITGERMAGTMSAQGPQRLTTTGNARIAYLLSDSRGGTQKLNGMSERLVWEGQADKKGTLLLEGNVQLSLPREAQPTELSARRVSIDLEANSFLATDDCRLAMESAVMTGNRMEGKLMEGEQFELFTLGNVVIKTDIASAKGEKRKVVATGEKSTYHSVDQSLTLSGNPLLKVLGEGSEGADVRGERIVVNLKSKKVTVETDDPGNPTQLDFRGGGKKSS